MQKQKMKRRCSLRACVRDEDEAKKERERTKNRNMDWTGLDLHCTKRLQQKKRHNKPLFTAHSLPRTAS